MQKYQTNKNAFCKFPLFYSDDGNTIYFIHMDDLLNDFMIYGTTIPFHRSIEFDLVGDMSQTYVHPFDHSKTYHNNIFTLGDYDKKLQKIQTEYIYNQKYTSKKPYKYTLNEYTSK